MRSKLPFRNLVLFVLLIAAFVMTTACHHEAATGNESAPAATETAAASIQWFDGTVEEAFAKAKQERRPVFLYWGAVWCPPCHALRTKLFTQPAFVAKLSATIPVYLDGDTDRAQIWGEKLNTYGYPTVIILDPDGNEITRIEGTLPVEQYGEAVSRAIEESKPIREIIAAVEKDGPAAVPPSELSILAFHSFGQDQVLDLDIKHQRELFQRLYAETPDNMPVEKSRFLTLSIFALADSDDDTPKAELDASRRAELTNGVKTTLADRTLRNSNLYLVLYGSKTAVTFLTPEPGAERDSLVAAWNDAATAIRNDESLSTDDRLSALLPRIRLAMLDAPAKEGEKAEVPEGIRNEVREGVKWASGVVKGEDEMQAVMSTMAGLLEDAGLMSEANELLSEKMSETTAPYYYMGWLAGNEAEAGDTAKAVELYRQAWLAAKESSGAASMSSFRWGSGYLRRAMQYTPDNVDRISADTKTIVDDLLSGSDAFAGGNWSRLQGVGTAMGKWSAEAPDKRGVALEQLRTQVSSGCERFPDEGPESAGGRCRSFLTTPPSS